MTDPVLRHRYGAQLESAAEQFLLSAFESADDHAFSEREAPAPVLVSAALHIVTRTAWTQPSDEQVKAWMFIGSGRGDRPQREDPQDRVA